MPWFLMGFSAAESNFLSRTAPTPAENCAEIDTATTQLSQLSLKICLKLIAPPK